MITVARGFALNVRLVRRSRHPPPPAAPERALAPQSATFKSSFRAWGHPPKNANDDDRSLLARSGFALNVRCSRHLPLPAVLVPPSATFNSSFRAQGHTPNIENGDRNLPARSGFALNARRSRHLLQPAAPEGTLVPPNATINASSLRREANTCSKESPKLHCTEEILRKSSGVGAQGNNLSL